MLRTIIRVGDAALMAYIDYPKGQPWIPGQSLGSVGSLHPIKR
nr:hypothetical protein Iba_chr02dCG6940 [Ipomoea batatas]